MVVRRDPTSFGLASKARLRGLLHVCIRYFSNFDAQLAAHRRGQKTAPRPALRRLSGFVAGTCNFRRAPKVAFALWVLL